MDIKKALGAPFKPHQLGWKAQVVQGNRALTVPYLDARDVMNRLDDVLGIGGWCDEYQILPEGSVVCKLSCEIDGGWVTKADVGSPSEQPYAGDRLKAAFSDALKRAAVKFGVGRYLYYLPTVWCDYDANKRVITHPPDAKNLPKWALPEEPEPDPKTPAASPPAGPNGDGKKFSTRQQHDEIRRLLGRAGMNAAAFAADVKRRFGHERVGQLTYRQADSEIDRLKECLRGDPEPGREPGDEPEGR